MTLTSLGKYKVTRQLGQGAMGEVYLAEDPDIGRSVAIKLLKSSSPGDHDRFRSEARIVGAFSHPNIVVLHDFGFQEDRPFLVLEYLPGESLESWLQQPHSLADGLKIMEGFLRALQYAHQRGVLHRDVKPSNIQVLPDGECKLMDFGIAQAPSAKLTATGTIMGTPSYMPPEIVEDARYSAHGDVYSAAVVVYEMLSGENPFHANSLPATLNKVLTVEPVALGTLRPELPPELAARVMACLAKHPEDRPPDVTGLLEAVRAASAPGAGISPRSTLLSTHSISRLPPLTRPSRGRRWAVTSGAVGVAGLAVLGWLLLRRPSPVEKAEVEPAAPLVASAKPETSPPPSTPIESSGPLATPSARPQPRATGPAPSPVPSTTPLPAAEPSLPPSPLTTPQASPSAAVSPPATAIVSKPPSTVSSEAPATTLQAVSPRTVRRGTVATLEVRGTGLSPEHEARILRGRKPATGLHVLKRQAVGTDLLRLSILVDEDVPLGAYAIVVVDAQGTPSNSVSLEVVL